jgi:hypothetical protein
MKRTSILAAAAISFAATANAQGITCGDRNQIIEQLEKTFQEVPITRGLQGNNALYETWANTNKGTWTILLSRPDGTACVMATGNHILINEDYEGEQEIIESDPASFTPYQMEPNYYTVSPYNSNPQPS